MNKRYELVLFDMDGTIADTDEMLKQTFYRLYDLYRDGQRTCDEKIYYFSGPPIKKTLSDEFPHLDVEFVYNEYIKISKTFYESTIIEMPNAKKILTYLKNHGVKLGVVTNKMKGSALQTLDIIDMNDIFDIVIGFNDVPVAKPDPMGINKAIEFINVSKDKVLYVGDNIVDDLSAKNAGIDSAIIYYGRRKMPDELKPTIKLFDFSDLIKEVFYE